MEVPFNKPHIGEPERREISQVLDSGWLTTGARCHRFEEMMQDYLGRKYAVSLNSGTAALHLAVYAANLEPGDGVLIPSQTFAATAEVAIHSGLIPVLVDSDPITRNIDLDYLEGLLADPTSHPLAKRGVKLPPFKAVMPVHFAGLMVDMERLQNLARQYGLLIIEDAAHTMPAYGLTKDGQKIGIGERSQSACLSFYANKNITTGEGGMLVTDDEELAERLKVLRLHGLDKNAWKRYSKSGAWRSEILTAGFKYNMPDLCAALGIHQLARSDQLWQRRKELAARYLELLGDVEALLLPNSPKAVKAMGGPDYMAGHSWHLYTINLLDSSKVRRDEFIAGLKEKDIYCAVHYQPLHLHPYYREMGYRPDDFPGAVRGFKGLISLPFFFKLTAEQQEYAARGMRELVEG
jgi:dTDP-4-amino-4,6-dideoxygalactose transaminase